MMKQAAHPPKQASSPLPLSKLLLLILLIELQPFHPTFPLPVCHSFLYRATITKQHIIPLQRPSHFSPITSFRNSSPYKSTPIPSSSSSSSTSQSSRLILRDASAANWFTVGDTVRVTTSVYKAGGSGTGTGTGSGTSGSIDLKDRIGTVVETWEKCEVDPTCCCAEFVDEHFAVRVRFQEEEVVEEEGGDNKDRTEKSYNMEEKDDQKLAKLNNHFHHYFAESELIQVRKSSE
mmetsp:Transcript_7966/g.11369  ORF Transcript_7966/g.11369 Transcript_7966/m.11369 type:complete len:234 (-) Transcript_7966:566-1267(-)